jgi:serine protease AprX
MSRNVPASCGSPPLSLPPCLGHRPRTARRPLGRSVVASCAVRPCAGAVLLPNHEKQDTCPMTDGIVMTSMTWRAQPARRVRAAASAAFTAAALVAGTLAGTLPPPAAASPAAADDPGAVALLDGDWGGEQADSEALAGGKKNRPDRDPGSLYTVGKAVGARKLWKHRDPAGRPLTGAGVTVALLDSGVSPVPGLSAPGKVVLGPDFSSDTDANTGDRDEFGHGTFMAGLIAAKDAARDEDGDALAPHEAGPDVQQGLAPDAGLLSLKLAGADGATSVDAVIDALAWTVAHKDDNGLKVRVVNLSFGADALQPYEVDPLAAAAEAAWHAGIVVVASVGNDGAADDALSAPALDPFVLAVGASDARGKVKGWNRPALADFSARATSGRHADLVAPGTSVVGLRVPGSTVDKLHPQGLVAGDASGRLFRGSGTSQAAALVSGAVALLLQARPDLTPDQVKAALTRTASPVHGAGPDAGAGQIDLEAALEAVQDMGTEDDETGLATTVQIHPRSNGLDGVATGDLSGGWNGARWNGARWNGARWNGARWNGARWNGGGWT